MCAQSWCPYVLRAAEVPLNWEWTVQCPDHKHCWRVTSFSGKPSGRGRGAHTSVTDQLAQSLCDPLCARVSEGLAGSGTAHFASSAPSPGCILHFVVTSSGMRTMLLRKPQGLDRLSPAPSLLPWPGDEWLPCVTVPCAQGTSAVIHTDQRGLATV